MKKKLIAGLLACTLLFTSTGFAASIDKTDLVKRVKGIDTADQSTQTLMTKEQTQAMIKSLWPDKVPGDVQVADKESLDSLSAKYYDSIMKKPLDYYGFYAIKSFSQINYTKFFDGTILGWANFDSQGNFTTTGGRTEFRTPEGADLVRSKIKGDGGKTYLMVFENERGKYEKLFANPDNLALMTQALKDYDGICLDFESLRDEKNLKEGFSIFVEKLRQANPDKQIITIIHPKNVVGYFDGYDYSRLAKASDYMLLMSYDYQTKAQPQSTAPFNKVVESVDLALKEIPAQKLILGIQAHGAPQWRLDKSTNILSYFMPTVAMVQESMSKKAISPQWDSKALSYYYVAEDDQYKSTIYYESPEALAYKQFLAKEKNLAGIAIWRLGNLENGYFDALQIEAKLKQK